MRDFSSVWIMTKRLLFICNPFSGRGVINQNLTKILDIFIKRGFEVTVHITQGKTDATKKVLESAKYFDRIVCSGGDGTLNEVTKGIMQVNDISPITLGYIPSGSTNDFGSSLGLSEEDVLSSAKIAAGDNINRIDIGKFNDDFFVYVAAFGLFTDVSYQTDQNLKNFLGHAAYVLEAMKTLQDIPDIPIRAEANGKIIEGNFIYGMVTNAVSVGGLKDFIKGDVKLSDGLFEVMLIRSPQNPVELAEIGSYLTNIRKETDLVYSFKTDSIKINSEKEISWTLDGEYGGEWKNAAISNISRTVDFLTRDFNLEQA